MTKISPALENMTPLGSGLLQVWDDTISDYATVGAASGVSLKTDMAPLDSAPSCGCAWGEVVRRHDARLELTVHTPRSFWLYERLYGFSTENKNASVLTTYTDTVTAETLSQIGTVAILPMAHFAGFALNISVTNVTTGATLTLGTDYDLHLISGLTALVSTGGFSLYDELSVTYDASVLTAGDLVLGTPNCAPPRRFRVMSDVLQNADYTHQNGRFSIVFDVADVVSPLDLTFAPCDSASSKIPLVIRNRPGAPFVVRFSAD